MWLVQGPWESILVPAVSLFCCGTLASDLGQILNQGLWNASSFWGSVEAFRGSDHFGEFTVNVILYKTWTATTHRAVISFFTTNAFWLPLFCLLGFILSLHALKLFWNTKIGNLFSTPLKWKLTFLHNHFFFSTPGFKESTKTSKNLESQQHWSSRSGSTNYNQQRSDLGWGGLIQGSHIKVVT